MCFDSLKIGSADKKRAVVVIVDSRRGLHWGCASLGGDRRARYMKLSVPPPPALDLAALYRTLRHENAHNLGLEHRDMDPALRYCLDRFFEVGRYTRKPLVEAYRKGIEIPDVPSWLWGFEFRDKPTRPEPSLETRNEKRLAHAQLMLARALRREKLAQTVLKRWKRRVRLGEARKERLAARPPDGAAR
jgi:hypothetical protein